jgi:hypothetical protein
LKQWKGKTVKADFAQSTALIKRQLLRAYLGMPQGQRPTMVLMPAMLHASHVQSRAVLPSLLCFF